MSVSPSSSHIYLNHSRSFIGIYIAILVGPRVGMYVGNYAFA